MIQINPRAWSAVLLLALAATASPVRADFNAAVAAYDRGDFPAAADQFERLARLGNPRAQYNFGLMLVQAQGRPRDLQRAFGWLEAAQANGEADAEAILAQLRTRKSLDAARARADSAPYSTALRQVLDRLAAADFDKMRRIERGKYNYRLDDRVGVHKDARPGLLGGSICAIFVDESGQVVDAFVLDEYPMELFDGSLPIALLSQQFPPATLDGTPIGVLSSLRVRLVNEPGSFDVRRYPSAIRAIRQFRERQEQGDAGAEVNLGRLAATFEELRDELGKPTDIFRSAAEQKVVDADYQLAFRALFGGDSAADVREGVDRLSSAAQRGYVPAQFLLGVMLLADPEGRGEALARDALQAAVAGGHEPAVRYLAGLLASARDVSLRDPVRALELIDAQISHPQFGKYPLVFEVAAAASAANGDYVAAVERQKRAIALAVRAEPKNSLRLQRLAAYQSGRPWTGALPVVPALRRVAD
jgi:TPR repeat protein